MQATQAAQVETAFCLVPANKLCQGFAKYWLYVSSQCGLMEYWTEQPKSLQFNKGLILLSQFLCFSSRTTKPRTFLVDILQSRLQQTVRRHNGAKLHLHIQTLQREALHCWHSRGQIWTSISRVALEDRNRQTFTVGMSGRKVSAQALP